MPIITEAILNELNDDIMKIFDEKYFGLAKNTPEFKLFSQAQRIINLSDFKDAVYDDKPYLISTQNQHYLDKTVPAKATDACVILGSGDTVFELVNKDIKNIVAIDKNKLQELVFRLRYASMLTLSHKDFCSFLIDSNNHKFMSSDVFSTVKEGFSKDAETELKAWELLFRFNPRECFQKQLFKNVGGNPKTIIKTFPYLESKPTYYETRDKLEKSNIDIKIMSMLDYLKDNPDKKFDYMDITNILLFVYQLECEEDKNEFKKVILLLKNIFEQNLNYDGVLVLDYLFGVDFDDLTDEKIIDSKFKIANTIYKCTTELVEENFDIETFQVNKQIDGFGDKQDRILLTRKKYNNIDL